VGTVTDQFNIAWRDFNTTGVPSSGDYEPIKSVIRGTGSIIESAISAAAEQQATAAAIQNILATSTTAGGLLPRMVVAIENGLGTGTGGLLVPMWAVFLAAPPGSAGVTQSARLARW
jgi:hypothetical protein